MSTVLEENIYKFVFQ